MKGDANGTMRRNYDLLIAGAGPAGMAAAIHLLRKRPELRGRVAAIDKARHPRFKVCAGGLISKSLDLLDRLGVKLEVPFAEVWRGAAVTEAGTIRIPVRDAPLCKVIRRDEFDAMLARAACQSGLELIENTRIMSVRQDQDRVRVATDDGEFTGRVLLGADGSGSRVRAEVFGRNKENIGRALMFDVPVKASGENQNAEHYQFDFRCISAGIPGYSWSFPCIIDGVAHRNVGIYEWRATTLAGGDRQARFLGELRRAFPALELDSDTSHFGYKAFPIRWYDPRDRYAAGRVILAGDAAGVDPLMGEGISFALEHGRMAADAIAHFLGGDGAALDAYDRALHGGYNRRKLGRLAFAARRFYGRRHRFYFKIAAASRHAQLLGLDWYNGANGVDETSAWRIAARCLTGIITRRPLPQQ